MLSYLPYTISVVKKYNSCGLGNGKLKRSVDLVQYLVLLKKLEP